MQRYHHNNSTDRTRIQSYKPSVGDKQDQTFGDYMNKKDADKKGADN